MAELTPEQIAFVDLVNEKLPDFIKNKVADLRDNLDFRVQPDQGILYSGDLLDRSEQLR